MPNGFGSKIRYNDGEGLSHADLEQAQDFARRSMFDELVGFLAAPDDVARRGGALGDFPGRDTVATMRTFRRALCPRERTATLTIDFDPGPVVQHDVAADLDPTSLVPETKMAYQVGLNVTLGAAHATLWRRDMVEARIVEANEANVSRDFEDAVTRAKSTSLIPKQSNLTVELQVVAGATQASAAAADLLAAEPATTAGWFKVCSVRVDPTATVLDQATLWDWRKPWGYGQGLIRPHGWDFLSATDVAAPAWRVNTDGSAIFLNTAGALAQCTPLHHGPHQIASSSDGTGHLEDHRRVASMVLRADFDSLTGLGGFIGSLDLRTAGFTSHPDGDFTSILGAFEADFQPYTAADFPPPSGPYTTRPLWSNGMTNPAGTGSAGGFEALEVVIDGPTGGTPNLTFLKFLHTSFWGGV